MKIKKEAKVLITVRIKAKYREKLNELAESEDRTVSSLVNLAIKKFLGSDTISELTDIEKLAKELLLRVQNMNE